MAVLGLRLCARAFSSCGKRGPLFIAVRRPLTIAASLVVEHRFQMRRLSNCGSRAQPLCGMWDLPRPGLEPVCPALAGRFSTTAPPGKPSAALKSKMITGGAKVSLSLKGTKGHTHPSSCGGELWGGEGLKLTVVLDTGAPTQSLGVGGFARCRDYQRCRGLQGGP